LALDTSASQDLGSAPVTQMKTENDDPARSQEALDSSATSTQMISENGDHPRLREAQKLFSNMLSPAKERPRRRHGSAPPLSSHVHDAAMLEVTTQDHKPSEGSDDKTPSKTFSGINIGTSQEHGGSIGAAKRRVVSVPPLRPLNGSIPDFPGLGMTLT
jgi:hypothetical protein